MLRLAAVALACAFSCVLRAQDDKPARSNPPMGWTGVLSEDEFRKLHELKGEHAPPARGEMVEFAGQRGYLTLPDGMRAPLPALVVIHEWWGLNEHVKHWADRLAADGYAALAVDLYGGKVATTAEEASATMRAVDEAAAEKTLLAAHAFLHDDPRVQASKRGCIGWCFGGGWSLRLAMAAPDLDAAVIYYGRLETDPTKLAAIRAPLLGVFGNRDRGIPKESVDAFAAAMKTAGRTATILRYDADHAFANPSGARYDATAAAAAWQEVRRFLADHLQSVDAPRPEMRTYVFGLLKAGPKRGEALDAQTSARLQEQHLAHIRAMSRRGEVVLAGPMVEQPGDDPIIGVLIFAVDKKAAQALTAQDPLVAAGRLRFELIDWYGPKWLADQAAK
ncbi:MAG: dienelactone hydrolase family protein [Planctomycetota bacterium]